MYRTVSLQRLTGSEASGLLIPRWEFLAGPCCRRSSGAQREFSDFLARVTFVNFPEHKGEQGGAAVAAEPHRATLSFPSAGTGAAPDTLSPAGLTSLRRKNIFLSIMLSPNVMQPNETTQIVGRTQAPALLQGLYPLSHAGGSDPL